MDYASSSFILSTYLSAFWLIVLLFGGILKFLFWILKVGEE